MGDIRELRSGETVRMRLEQEDKNGRIMWDLTSSWYGFDNDNANNFSIGLLKAVAEYTQTLSGLKNS